MGQFVAVIAPHASVAKSRLSKLLPVCEKVLGQTACGMHEDAHCAVASFGRTAVQDESGQIVHFGSGAGWCLGVGTWTCADGDLETWAATNPGSDIGERISRLDGGFAVLLGHENGRTIHIATDHVGQLHVYRCSIGEATLISTSALVLSLLEDSSWDITGVREFMATGTVFGSRSLFDGVKKLKPATILEFREGRAHNAQCYWSIVDHIDGVPDSRTAIDEFGAAVKSSMSTLFSGYKAPVLDLTGGFDTRILLSCARQVAPTQTLNTAVVGATNAPDVTAARRIADEFGLDHRRIDPSPGAASTWWELAEAAIPLTDGECDSLEYANILSVHNRLAAPFDISINGSAGGFIRGNWWELLWPHTGAKGRFDARRVARARFATEPDADRLLATQFPIALDEHFEALIKEVNEPLLHSRNTASIDNVYLILRLQRWQGRLASATNRIRPCASPMAFRRPLEIALGAPVDCRRNSRMARNLLAALDRELASLPMAAGYPALPISLETLPQFAPLVREYAARAAHRLRRTLFHKTPTAKHGNERLEALLQLDAIRDDYLNPSAMLTRELYDPSALDHFLQSAYAGNMDSPGRIGRVLTLEQIARVRKIHRLA